MRLFLLLCLLFAGFFSGCAYEGVVVRKNSRPQPFYETLGIDGSYTLILRDRAGALRRQLVTPDVFDRYAVGDYFNDLQPAAFRDHKAYDHKEMWTATRTDDSRTRFVSRRKAVKSRQLAFDVRRAPRNLAKRIKPPTPKTETLRLAQVSRIAKPTVMPRIPPAVEPEIVFVHIARCR